jgi:hypothetical protein
MRPPAPRARAHGGAAEELIAAEALIAAEELFEPSPF